MIVNCCKIHFVAICCGEASPSRGMSQQGQPILAIFENRVAICLIFSVIPIQIPKAGGGRREEEGGEEKEREDQGRRKRRRRITISKGQDKKLIK